MATVPVARQNTPKQGRTHSSPNLGLGTPPGTETPRLGPGGVLGGFLLEGFGGGFGEFGEFFVGSGRGGRVTNPRSGLDMIPCVMPCFGVLRGGPNWSGTLVDVSFFI